MVDLTSSQEDYLEAILELGGTSGGVRTSDIADRLGVRRASVSATLRVLAARGLLLVGLDVIGEYLTEINVTSPTGFAEIAAQTGLNVAAMFVDALEAALR